MSLRRVLAFVAMGFALAVPAQQVKTFSGGLTNGHYRFNRPQDFTTTYSGQWTIFHVYKFTNTIAQTVTATASGTGFTPWLFFYDFSFNPQDQVLGLYGVGQGSVSVSLPAAAFTPYYLVVAGNLAGDVGNYSGSFTAGNVGIDTNYLSALSIYSHPVGNTVQSGNPYTLYAYSAGRLPHNFQWYRGPRPASTNGPNPAYAIAGATAFSYTIPSVTVETSYWCNISASGLTTTNRRSSEVTVTPVVGPAVFSGSLTGQHDTWNRMTQLNVSSGQTCYYETVTFQIVTPGTYTTQVNTVGFPASQNLYYNPFDPIRPYFNFVSDGVLAGGAGELRFTNFLSAGTYDLVVSSVSAFQTGTFTGLITGAATPVIIPGPTTPSIWSQSSGSTILTGLTAALQFSALGKVPRYYQWFTGSTYGASAPVPGATNKNYTTPVFTTVGDRWYWARVTNIYGAATTDFMRVQVLTNAPVFSGNLRPGNRQWHRSNGAGGSVPEWSYYKIYAFEVQQAGTYTSSFAVAGGVNSLDMYSAVFDPSNPNLSHYATLTGGNPMTLVTPNLPAGNYHLVFSTTAALATGTFTGSVKGPSLIRERGTPVFTQPPAPLTQTYWPLEQPTAITNSVTEPTASYEWYPGLAPGVPADGQTAIPGAVSNVYVPSPTSSSRWFYARAYNAYGYDDGTLAAVIIRPKPSFAPPPANTNFNYAMPATATATVTDIPFVVVWQTLTGSTVIASATTVVQGVSGSYLTATSTVLYLSNLNVGTYSLRVVATNPSGVATSAAATATVARRPLSVTVAGVTNVFDGSTQTLAAIVSDPIPGPVLPPVMPYAWQYLRAALVLSNGAYDAGSWTGRVDIVHSNFSGGATGLLVITRRPLTVSVSDSTQEFDGLPKTNSVAFTDPVPGPLLPVPMPQTRQYADGLHTLTNTVLNSGVWTVRVEVAHSNFQGIGSGLLTVTRSNLYRTAASFSATGLSFQIVSRWGQAIDLQTASNLFGLWTSVTSGLTADSNEVIQVHLPLATNAPRLFYRAYAP